MRHVRDMPTGAADAALLGGVRARGDAGARDAQPQVAGAAHACRRPIPRRRQPGHVLVRRLGARDGTGPALAGDRSVTHGTSRRRVGWTTRTSPPWCRSGCRPRRSQRTRRRSARGSCFRDPPRSLPSGAVHPPHRPHRPRRQGGRRIPAARGGGGALPPPRCGPADQQPAGGDRRRRGGGRAGDWRGARAGARRHKAVFVQRVARLLQHLQQAARLVQGGAGRARKRVRLG